MEGKTHPGMRIQRRKGGGAIVLLEEAPIAGRISRCYVRSAYRIMRRRGIEWKRVGILDAGLPAQTARDAAFDLLFAAYLTTDIDYEDPS